MRLALGGIGLGFVLALATLCLVDLAIGCYVEGPNPDPSAEGTSSGGADESSSSG